MLPNNPRLYKYPPDIQEKKKSHDKNAISKKLAICEQGANFHI